MITLSIVSHDQAPLIAALLGDLAAIDSPLITSILVTQNVPETMQDWPAVLASRVTLIVNASPKGFGANHNAAFANCTTPYFAVMNPDLHLLADPFQKLIDVFADDPATPRARPTGMAAPYIVDADGVPEDSARRLMTPVEMIGRRFASEKRAPSKRPHWLAGMFLLIASPVFRSVGGFDERYFMYCEDFDLSARLRLNGWDFKIVTQAVVMHAAQRASHRSRRHLLWHLSSLRKMWASSTFWRYRRLLIEERRC